MNVRRVRIDDPAWATFVAAHPTATAFHLPQWATLIADCYGFEPHVLTLEDHEGASIGGVPVLAVRSPFGARRWVSLPFTDHCPLLVRADAPLDEIVAALSEYVGTSPVAELEVRSALVAADGVHPLARGYHHSLALPRNPDDLRPHKAHRNNRNRAQRNGVTVTRESTREAVHEFYRLHAITRRGHGVPVQPSRFFDLIADRMIGAGHGFVAHAKLDGKTAASGLYIGYNGTLIAKYGASDPEFGDLGAGYLLDWEVMRAACTEGYHAFDFGRTDLAAEGLRRYKLGWGAEERPLVYTSLSRRPPALESPRGGTLSRTIIRHSPLWVCRALGEVFYRWAA